MSEKLSQVCDPKEFTPGTPAGDIFVPEKFTLAKEKSDLSADLDIASAGLDGYADVLSLQEASIRAGIDRLETHEERVDGLKILMEISRLSQICLQKGRRLSVPDLPVNEMMKDQLFDELNTILRDRRRLAELSYLRGGHAEVRGSGVLKGRKSFGELTLQDFKKMKLAGVDCMRFFMVDTENVGDPLNVSDLESLTDRTLTVDFGGNKELSAGIGADDILPREAKRVLIDDVECERRTNGYFSTETGRYVPIKDGTEIEILEVVKNQVTEGSSKLGRDLKLENTLDTRRADISEISPQGAGKILLQLAKSRVERNRRTKTTLCSKTAQDIAARFGFDLPSGNARDAFKTGYSDEEGALYAPKTAFPSDCSDEYIFWDLLVRSNTRNGKRYGHRCVCFRNPADNQIYVSDPYVRGRDADGVRLLSQYATPREKILEARGYTLANCENDQIRQLFS